MKNKWVRAVLGISVIALCLGGGYWLGRQSDPGRQEEAPPAESRENEEEYDTDLIAIVNMDEGVQKGSETVIYSQSLLGTLDVSYEVTGMEAAKQGLENGTYSAYLILPGGFSAAVESINTSPQKAVLEYAISQELTKEALADAVDHVQDIYASLNNGIGELYLSSVLSEVHKVQDAVGTISENDTADLNALEGIRGDDLRETVQMPELQEVEMDIDVLDLAPDYRPWDNPVGGSDNGSFARVGIPIIWYHTDGHPDYHQPSDHAERINWDKVVNITKASFLNMWNMANESF